MLDLLMVLGGIVVVGIFVYGVFFGGNLLLYIAAFWVLVWIGASIYQRVKARR